jgi:hypothetical protein
LHSETLRLVQRHERDIEHVARALQAKMRLSGDEISSLLAEAA